MGAGHCVRPTDPCNNAHRARPRLYRCDADVAKSSENTRASEITVMANFVTVGSVLMCRYDVRIRLF